MRITARQLRQIIKEELTRSMYEGDETSAAQTKVEPEAPKPETPPADLVGGHITYNLSSGIPQQFEALAGPGLLELTVSGGKSRFTTWLPKGKKPIGLIILKGQIGNYVKNSTLEITALGGFMNKTADTDLPDGKHYFAATCTYEDTKLQIKFDKSGTMQERRHRRR